MENDPVLFSNFSYGMSKEEITRSLETGPCADAPHNQLLLCANSPVNFLDRNWSERFSFNNLGELQQIALYSDKKEDFKPVLQALLAQGWHEAFLETEDSAFDCLNALILEGATRASQAARSFADTATGSAAPLTAYFLSTAFVTKIIKEGKAKDYLQALDAGPENIVTASLHAGEAGLRLSFTAPRLSRKNALRYGQMIKRQ